MGRAVRTRAGIGHPTYDRTDHGHDSDGDPTCTEVYVFTDRGGRRREYRGEGRRIAEDPKRIQVAYDPENEERVGGRYGPVARVLMLLVHVLVGLPVALLTAAYPAAALAVLLSAAF
ncbi:hypothetical protein [Streptomyces sp. SGAir0957]